MDAVGVGNSGVPIRLQAFGTVAGPRRIPNGRRMLFLVEEATGEPVTPNAWSVLELSNKLSPPLEVKLEIRD